MKFDTTTLKLVICMICIK